jgi:hypothetical protein
MMWCHMMLAGYLWCEVTDCDHKQEYDNDCDLIYEYGGDDGGKENDDEDGREDLSEQAVA